MSQSIKAVWCYGCDKGVKLPENVPCTQERKVLRVKGQSGPESALFGNEDARGCVLGFAKYILNIRAVSLSGPNVHSETSYALRIHSFAFMKSDACVQLIQVRIVPILIPAPNTDHHAKLKCVKAERGFVMHYPFFL